ncbi:MAG: carboxypeptidase-like regulatory domain-containing protein, partial [Bacteroidales bacterium]|nr:carboxypeptidase-like regulatory domain-containing protein [Bacteroidales bacterium]
MNQLLKHLLFCAIVAAAATFQLQAQTQTIRGTVSEAGSGEPVYGAVVKIDGTSRGTMTDLDGRYSIEARAGETLVCSLLGYTTFSAVVGEGRVIDFSLTPDTQALSEAVVVGYGTLKKTQLVGAVETLDAEALEGRANSDVTRSLQGQVPGLNIIQTDGKPSHSGNVYIRGNSTSYQSRISATNAESSSHSIGQGGSALVLIDGVEGSLSNVNPDDILTVSVLKDAASAS